MKLALRRPTMDEQHALDLGSFWLWGMNVVLGLITLDVLNLVVAALGFVAMLAANLVKIILAFQELRVLARNKWKKPIPPENDKE